MNIFSGDYIVGIDILEETKSPVELLKQCHNLLSSAGRFLLHFIRGFKLFCVLVSCHIPAYWVY